MRKFICILALLALLAALCWRQRPGAALERAASGTASQASDSPSVSPGKPIAAAGTESNDVESGNSETVANVMDSSATPDRVSPLSQKQPGRVKSAAKPFSPETAYLATLPPTEAIVLEEEENGQVTYRASQAELRAAGFPLLLQATMQKPDGAAASDLVAMFQSEQTVENKLDILSASSLLEPDQNTDQILELALRSDQPPELRISALAYAADQGSFILQSYVNDPDPDVRLEAQCAYDNLAIPTPTNIVGSQPPPAPLNLARPPDWINQARAN